MGQITSEVKWTGYDTSGLVYENKTIKELEDEGFKVNVVDGCIVGFEKPNAKESKEQN